MIDGLSPTRMGYSLICIDVNEMLVPFFSGVAMVGLFLFLDVRATIISPDFLLSFSIYILLCGLSNPLISYCYDSSIDVSEEVIDAVLWSSKLKDDGFPLASKLDIPTGDTSPLIDILNPGVSSITIDD